MNVDLHMHTTCSDGVYAPAALVKMAADAGLSAIAISDHDTVGAYAEAPFNAAVRVIPAIEISSDYDGEDVHVLGYYVDWHDADLQEYCSQFKKRRQMRAMEIVERCEELGYLLDRGQIDAVVAQGGTIGRPHIARMLVEKGYFPDVKTVFDKLLYRGGPAYVPYSRRTIDECIELIHGAGGLAFLAHPALLHKALAPVLTHSFDGIEVYHPRNAGRYDELLAVAKEKGWYVSGGSDFHGVPGRFPEKVGEFTVPSEQVEALLTYGRG